MDLNIHDSWKDLLKAEFEKPYFKELVSFVENEYLHHTVYPERQNIFNAFNHCTLDKTKVVIVGQDPYHGPGQANGLSFSVNDGISFPPSLKNIFKELTNDLGVPLPVTGNLERWSKQGVLLLNATLTVRATSAGSHQKKGWEEFTGAVIKKLAENKKDIVFILWGAYAQKKGTIIDQTRHFILQSPHPSPFSVYKGFYGSKPFSKTNNYLKSKGLDEIKW